MDCWAIKKDTIGPSWMFTWNLSIWDHSDNGEGGDEHLKNYYCLHFCFMIVFKLTKKKSKFMNVTCPFFE